MIEAPAGWRQSFGAHVTTLHPPTGGGRIRYHERLPPRGLAATVRALLSDDPSARTEIIGKSLPIVTEEGELGVIVPTRGLLAGLPVVRILGIVITDEVFAALDTLIQLRTQLALLERVSRELLLSVSLGLGVRRRRYRYQPPAGWQAIPNGLVATWIPPGYPNDPTHITVYPANPRTETPAALFQALLRRDTAAGLAVAGEIDSEPLVSAAGLEGQRFRFTGSSPRHPWVAHEVAIGAAGAYRYVMRLETASPGDADAHRRRFDELLRSAEPAPAPGRRVGGFADARAVASLATIWAE
jgi:hypothetical protein